MLLCQSSAEVPPDAQGKSVWVYYALRCRMAEKKSAIWLYKGAYYLFVEDGVYRMPSDFQRAKFLSIVWTFIDSDESEIIPVNLISRDAHLFVIYTTPPVEQRWSLMQISTENDIVIMNPWTRGEILRVQVAFLTVYSILTDSLFSASMLLPDEPTRDTRVNEAFDLLGPTPRLCISFMSEPIKLEEYKREVTIVISNITPHQLGHLNDKVSSLNMDSLSDKIFLLSRQDQDDVHSSAVVDLITQATQSRLASQFRQVPQVDLIRLYKQYSGGA